MSQYASDAVRDQAIAHVAAQATGPPLDPDLRVSLNFHPDREVGSKPILVALRDDGVYRSQFETGTGNGGLTAYPGGDRWRWESRIFGGAYDAVPSTYRPKYGALDHRRRPTGAAPRFGSAHLRLRGHTLDRTTFCYPDSVFEPVDVGVAAAMSLIALADADDKDPLDDYIEAQVHGPVRIDTDVEALVLDPCFRGTDVEASAALLPFPVEWHHGLRLETTTLRDNPDYRGESVVSLGSTLAVGGFVDARIIGAAARTGEHAEQDLKRLWHCVARFGRAIEPADDAPTVGPTAT